MKAAIMRGIRDVAIADVPMPEVRPDEALVRIRSVGVCGSDVHYYVHGRIGRFIVQPPFILGHECAGDVVEVGKDVRNLRRGDRVAIEPGVPCRRCGFCRQGRYNLCRDVVFLATPPVQGAFVEYLAHPADFLFPLPESVSTHAGAMVEPLSTGMQAVHRSGLKVGDRVFISGAGPIGLMTLQAFRAAGAGEIFASDVIPERMQLALQLGATAAFNGDDPELAARLRDRTEGLGPEIVVETAGSAKATSQAIDIVRPGGVIVLVGLAPSSTVPIDTLAAIDKEIDIRGVFRYANTYAPAIALLARGAVDVGPMITGEYPLDRANEALSDVAARKPGTIKAVVVG